MVRSHLSMNSDQRAPPFLGEVNINPIHGYGFQVSAKLGEASADSKLRVEEADQNLIPICRGTYL